MERGETSADAVRREFAEELGIEVVPIERLGSIRLTDSKYILAVWRVEHRAGDFHLAEAEIAELKWVTLAEIRTVRPGLRSNYRVFEMLEKPS